MYRKLHRVPKEDFEKILRDPFLFRDWEQGNISRREEEYPYILIRHWKDVQHFVTPYIPSYSFWYDNNVIYKLFFSGVLLGEDLEYDCSHWGYSYLTPDEVSELSAKLAAITEEQLRKNFEGCSFESEDFFYIEKEGEDEATEIDEDGLFGYMMQEYKCVKDFYTVAAEKGEAVIYFESYYGI